MQLTVNHLQSLIRGPAPQAAELEEEASAQYERAAAAEEEAGAAEARSYAAAKQLEDMRAQLQVRVRSWCGAVWEQLEEADT